MPAVAAAAVVAAVVAVAAAAVAVAAAGIPLFLHPVLLLRALTQISLGRSAVSGQMA